MANIIAHSPPSPPRYKQAEVLESLLFVPGNKPIVEEVWVRGREKRAKGERGKKKKRNYIQDKSPDIVDTK